MDPSNEARALPVPTEAPLLRAVTDFDEMLSRAVIRGRGLDGIAHALREVTRRDAALWSSAGQVLASTGEPIALPSNGSSDGRRGDWLCREVEEDDACVVAGVLDVEAATGPFEELLLARAARIAVVELFRMRSVAHTELKQWGDLTTAILEDDDPDRVATLAESLGVDVAEERRVVVLPTEISPPDRERLRVDARALDDSALETVRDDQPVFILRNEIDWSAFARSVEQTGDDSLRVGASSPAATVHDLPSALREARLAQRMSAAIDGPRVTHFEDLGLYQLFASCDPTELERLVRQWLAPITDYDRERGTDLLETLSQYLETGCSPDQAAAALHIHRSTLRYRLGRIEEQLGLDLRTPDTRFHLQLATRALATLEAMRQDGPGPSSGAA